MLRCVRHLDADNGEGIVKIATGQGQGAPTERIIWWHPSPHSLLSVSETLCAGKEDGSLGSDRPGFKS